MSDVQDRTWDVIVCGAGPAGRAIAGACARQGLRSLCVAPDAHQPWENNFGVWVDELDDAGIHDVYDTIWPRAIVTFDDKRDLSLQRPYGRVDAAKLRASLQRDTGDLLSLHAAGVEQVVHASEGSTLQLDDGRSLRTRLVIDATGFGGRFLEDAGNKGDVWQVAYGAMARVKRHPFPLDAMWFMDFRDSFLPDQSGLPTMLYAMPFGHDRIFVEETSVVARPAAPMELIKERLALRMESLDVQFEEIEWEEHCYIPTNPPVPSLKQRVVGFGAAAGLVHPNSGYSVSLSLRLAAPLARAIAAEFAAGGSADQIAHAAWATLWTPGRLRMRKAHLFGMKMFCRANSAQMRLYLKTLWRMPDRVWQGYLSASVTPSELGKGLLRM